MSYFDWSHTLSSLSLQERNLQQPPHKGVREAQAGAVSEGIYLRPRKAAPPRRVWRLPDPSSSAADSMSLISARRGSLALEFGMSLSEVCTRILIFLNICVR